MPKFSLTNDELANLTDYLSSLKEPENKSVMLAANLEGLHTAANFDSGRRLIKKYGCYSCHAIPGFENNVEKIAPELTDFAAKDPHLLFWGTKNKVPHKDRNWYSWTRAKLDEPKNFETDRIEAIMPNFHLSASETDDLLSFLKTLSSQKTVAAEHRRELRSGEADKIAGWQAMNHYGCIGCHSLYRKDETKLTGGFHKTAVAQYGVIAPNLSPEGDRVRKDWLGDFLKTPYKMRPYLNATMPAFNLDEEERDSLVAYFKSNATMTEYLGKKESSFDSPVSDPVAGKNLLSRYQCVTCHKVNGQELPASNQLRWYKDMEQARKMAPDLVHAVDKLNPSWANRWMENPHAIMPDTTMPFTALSREDASAIRSYLNSLGQSQPTAAK